MSLTKDDLQSLKTIVADAVDDSKLQVAAGFAEVHEKLVTLDGKTATIDGKLVTINSKIDDLTEQGNTIAEAVERIDRTQQAELERNDRQDAKINKIRKALHTPSP